jgi:hypothetical protein
MAGYTRQSTFTDGDVITAAHSNDEFDQVLAAFNNTSGHAHDGTSAEGPVIGLIGDAGVAAPLNKIVVDTTNDQLEFNIDVSGTSTEQFVVKDGVIEPTTDNDIDLGSTTKEFKNLYLDGTATIDGLAMPTTTVTDILDEDTMSSNSATALATQQSIKAYVDAQLTAADLDFQGDTGGALSIDLDSETLDIAGGTGIDTSGAGNTLTVAIDSTVATLTGSQTLTNKTLTTPVISSISNTGTVTLPTSTDTLVGRATTDTLTNKTLTSAVLNTGVSGTAILDEDNMASDSATQLATQQSIKAYVDAQVATKDALSELSGDSDDITEGTTNLFFTNERVDDRVNGLLTAGSNITLTYDDTANTLTIASTDTEDDLSNNDTDDLSEGTTNLYFTDERVDDRVNGLLTAGSNITLTYDDAANTLTIASTDTGLTDIVNDASPQLGGILDTNSFDVDFNDSAKARFGTGNDLQIFHDGSHSYIRDLGTGDLRLHGSAITISDASDNKMAHFVDGGTAELYYNANKKLETVTGGVTVTGKMTSDTATIANLTYPSSDGTANQAIVTDGSGNLSFTSVAIDDPTALSIALG